MMDSPLLTGGFYTGVLELQKKLETTPFADEFIYAERLFLNSDFVPNIKLPNEDIRKNIRKQIEIANLRRANDHYASVLDNLNNLKKKAKEQGYNKPFLEFCQQQNLAEYIETKDEIINIFKNKNEVKAYFSHQDNIESLKGFTNQIIEAYKKPNGGLYKITNNLKILDKRQQIKKYIKDNILGGIDNDDTKDGIAEVLMDEKIRTMLLSEPDNHALKAKFFDTLPNIGLLKGFEIKEKADFTEMNFIEHLDDYIGFVESRQIQTMDRLKAMGQSIQGKELSDLRKEHENLLKIRLKTANKIISIRNRKIKTLKEYYRRNKNKRKQYSERIEKIKNKRKLLLSKKKYWQQNLLDQRQNKQSRNNKSKVLG